MAVTGSVLTVDEESANRAPSELWLPCRVDRPESHHTTAYNARLTLPGGADFRSDGRSFPERRTPCTPYEINDPEPPR